jgi:hypothetical protein
MISRAYQLDCDPIAIQNTKVRLASQSAANNQLRGSGSRSLVDRRAADDSLDRLELLGIYSNSC